MSLSKNTKPCDPKGSKNNTSSIRSTMITSDPHPEVDINEELVKTLIETQFPAFSHLEISLLDAGWDNENYRLGPDYIIRLPRREVAVALLLHEIAWLPKLKDKLPLNIPAPIGVGKPDDSFPWPWSIIPWFEGQTANLHPPAESEALKLIAFLTILHQQDPEHAPFNSSRSVPLVKKDEAIQERIKRLKEKTNLVTPRIEEMWAEAIQEAVPRTQSLIHGDLHARNIIIHGNEIEAIIDWGDITAGDPATDFACLWMLFENDAIRQEAFHAYGATQSLIKRAMGWAIFFGITLLDTGLNSNLQHAHMGEVMLKNIISS